MDAQEALAKAKKGTDVEAIKSAEAALNTAHFNLAQAKEKVSQREENIKSFT
ncbi:MAG: hypothetical protein H6925_05605 [Holosporaceae bacterium]|nr:MAG: hypothetical protein H6925_05605 [Holosporaceae bacterium]